MKPAPDTRPRSSSLPLTEAISEIGPVPEADRRLARRIVRDALRQILPTLDPSEIRDDHRLVDLGADSVDRVEIVLAILERLGSEEPMSSFDSILDVAGLIDYCGSRVAP